MAEEKEDRRVQPRHLACFPVHAKVDESGNRIAVIKDISVTGALLLTRSQFEVGDRMELSMYLTGDPDGELTVATGKVVRAERRPEEVSDLWGFSAAVRFDEPLVHLEDQIKAVAAHQRKVHGSG